MIKHFYHVYADGEWRDAVDEHFTALDKIDAGMIDLHVLAVGSVENCDEALRHVRSVLPRSVAFEQMYDCDQGWEQETLAWLYGDATGGYNKNNSPYLYCHTKGAYNTASLNVEWRRSMTRHTVERWRECLRWLKLVDVVGCHWLTKQQFDNVDTPFFGGNYWWATAEYIRTLPPPPRNDRWDAERWIGQGRPRSHDLYPGWPNFA